MLQVLPTIKVCLLTAKQEQHCCWTSQSPQKTRSLWSLGWADPLNAEQFVRHLALSAGIRQNRAKNGYLALADWRQLCHQDSSLLSHAIRQWSTPFLAPPRGAWDDGYVPFIHLCPDSGGTFPNRSTWVLAPSSGTNAGGPVDGRPHGIQMTPPGGGT